MRPRDENAQPDSPEGPLFDSVPGIDVVDGELLPRTDGPVTPGSSR
ncbi:hypothetical protein QE377_001934 [Microbacterium sp. SORGH_AS 862]|nr:hypothetical protein [Microbacterium sp. SORGH_AS_0862]